MSSDDTREKRSHVILAWVCVLLVLCIVEFGYLSYRQFEIVAICAGLVLVWRSQDLRYYRQHSRAMDALQASEARFHLMFEYHGAVMLQIDPQTGMILDANHSAEHFYGYSKATLCTMNIEHMNTLSSKQVAAEYKKMMSEDRGHGIFSHKHADETERIVEIYSSPISVQEKSVLFLIIHDITERKYTELVVYAQRDLARVIGTVSSSQAAWPLCVDIALRVSGMDCGGIYIFDEDRQVIELVYQQGLGATFVQAASRYTVDSPNVRMLFKGKPLYFNTDDIQAVPHLQQEGVRTIISIPIRYQGRILGAINVGSHTQTHVSEFARHALETIATEIGNIVVYLRTEEALHRSTQILSDSQTIANLASWTADLQTGSFTASAGGSTLIAWIAGMHTVHDLMSIVHPDDREYIQSTWMAALHGAPFVVDYRILVHDEVRWIHVMAKITVDQQQQPISAMGIVQDVTGYKQAEIALRRSEERYRGLMESLDSAIHAIDPDGRFLYINEVAARLFACTPDDIIGKTLYDVFPHGAATSQLERLRQVVIQDRKVISEWQGAIFGEPRWYHTSMQPIHDETGRVIFVLVNSTDIHDLKMAQQELFDLNRTLEDRVRQRTAEVQDLYDNAPNGYHSLDGDGTLSMVNQTELTWLGYAHAEMLGRPFTDFITQQSRAAFQAEYALFKQRGSMRGLEFECIRKDGTTFHTLIDATAIYDQQGNYVMSRSTLVDNTERKKAEETLRRANSELARAARTKDEFLANMSHELRTPLNAVLGLSEGLLEEIHGPLSQHQRQSLTSIMSSGHHLLMLINDILDLSKVEAGRLDLQIDLVSVADVCQASLMFVREMAIKKSLRLTFQMNDQIAEMEVDPKRLKQMLVNLLSNAVKFTPAKGQVSLNVTIDTAMNVIRFMVQDTGIGIVPDDMPRLFQPFMQLDSSLSRQYEGTGLGLALVRRLANLHGGSVTVESTLGQGSCFTITLPYRVSHTVGAEPTNPPLRESVRAALVGEDGQQAHVMPEPKPGPSGQRVLLVEDNEGNIQAMVDYLHAKGFDVVFARTGQEALDRVAEELPLLILMDIQMPEMDGLEAIRRLRARPASAATPIIALTALAMPGDRDRCLEAGANEYMTKPVNLRRLTEMILTLI